MSWTVVLLFGLLSPSFAADDLIVETQGGKVQGTTFTSPNGREFYTWRHIPYAKPPFGDLRFQPPVKPDSWTDILDGSKDSPACLFVGSYEGDPIPTYGYSEDCLYINVYSPIPANSSARLPVMFWIYGGGFIVGTGDFSFTDPTALLEENVIVVTFNYRLDIFGFLSTEDSVVPGNAALKDQRAALIWTKENIAFFGGDPMDVTIFGESAGAISVGYHIISPMSRNLFQGAIMQSGTALVNYQQANPRAIALEVARQVDPTITDESSSETIKEVLQVADAQLLINVSLAMHSYTAPFIPIIEVEEHNPTPFISRPLYEEIAIGNVTNVPIIIGTNSEEQLTAVKTMEDVDNLAQYYDANPILLLPNMNLKDDVSNDTVTKLIKEAYAENDTFQHDPGSLIRLLSDSTFVRAALKHAVLQSERSNVYFYEFSFVGTRSAERLKIPGCGEVGHADEVGYLFNISTKPIETEADYLTRSRLVKLWTNFAKTKNPTPGDDSAELLQNVIWEPLDKDNLQYLDIGENLELKYHREAETTAFWDSLWEDYSFHPYNTY
ncbi:carboxylic ester hydrolase-like [Euwallacea fornicatus]|uniref:carboxylic ester hydrolase-like n=1 Tax=Euwallacea fornicatus TaxID=995702 RepID=UPI00338DAE52